MEEKANDHPNIQLDQLEETEDALSFCDLSLYSSPTSEWANLSKQNQRFSTSSSSSAAAAAAALSDQDMFEFFSEEWSKSNNSSTYPPLHQNILFCGKIFPLRQPISDSHRTTSTQNLKTQKPNPRKCGFFRWKKNAKFFRRNRTNNSVSLHTGGCGYNKVRKSGEKCGFTVGRVPILSPRWQLMVFGLGRLPPGEMELSDIRSRMQRRRRSPAPAAAAFSVGNDEKVNRGKKGLWWLLRSLYKYCGGGHHYRRPSAAVKT